MPEPDEREFRPFAPRPHHVVRGWPGQRVEVDGLGDLAGEAARCNFRWDLADLEAARLQRFAGTEIRRDPRGIIQGDGV